MRSFCIAVAVSTLATTILTAAPGLGGEYTDPEHYVDGASSFAGTRMVSDNFEDKTTSRITLVGSDDGVEFWTLFGEWIDPAAGKLVIDFSPKGGPKDFPGTFAAQTDGSAEITFEDGNKWTRATSPPTSLQ